MAYNCVCLVIHTLKSKASIPPRPPLWEAVACAPVTQRARVRSPAGTSFQGEFSEFFLTCKTNVRKLQAPKVPEYHLAIIIITHLSLRAPMT